MALGRDRAGRTQRIVGGVMNPRCICDEIFVDWERDGIDAETWALEEEHRLMWGHYASCNHRSQQPKGLIRNTEKRAKLRTTAEIQQAIENALRVWWERQEPWGRHGNGAG